MLTPGTILKLVIEVTNEVDDSSDLSLINTSGAMWVADPGGAPYPGLPIDLGDFSADAFETILAHEKDDLHEWATTGTLPLG